MSKELKEGRILIHECQSRSQYIVARIKCETDFLAKSDTLYNALLAICKIIDREEDGDVGYVLTKLKKESGEKIEFMHTIWDILYFHDLPSNYYLHHDNKKVAFVQLETDAPYDEAKKLAYDLSMHVVAFSPKHISEKDPGFDWEDIDLEISEELLKNKPQNIIKKITMGKKEKYKKENMLLYQPFVKNFDKTVKNEIEEFNELYSTNVKVLGFLELVV